MKLIDNVLFLEFDEAVECGISEETIKKARLRKSSSWHFMDDPDDRRKVLVGYEKLKEEYKRKVQSRFGNPYEYVSKNPLRRMVKYDHQAEAFYMAYRYGNDKMLGIDYVKKYTMAASWLNMLRDMNADKKLLKKLLNIPLETFYAQVIEIVKADKIDLPTSYRRLMAKRAEYEEKGYSSLIDWRFGNQLAAKIKDEVSESVLLEMLAQPNQFDDVYICMAYNQWAVENNYKPIDVATVGVWRRKKHAEIIMQREGNSALNEKFLRQVKGFRPTTPLYMVESDDNHIDLLFIDPNDDTPHKYYHKYKAIVVVDSYNDYVLGYAYATELSIELVRTAYVDAMYHIRELTGGWYLPHETKSDKWAIKSLMPFYQSMGNYIETPVGSKHRGYIEQFFGSPHWKRCLKIGANNYTGNNLTARNRGVNTEMVNLNRKDRPVLGKESEQQIEAFFYRLRHLPQGDKPSKQAEWLAAWEQTPAEKKRQITDEQFLHKFGIVHNQGKTIRITNRGVEPQILGKQYSYDLCAENLYEYIGKAVQVIYDPYDMSRVLLTDGENLRIMATSAQLQSRALADARTGSREFLNAMLSEKVDTVTKLAGKAERRREVLASIEMNPENLLTGGVMLKELKQSAEEHYQQEFIEAQVPAKQLPKKQSSNFFDQM